jgi:hypothetical protein
MGFEPTISRSTGECIKPGYATRALSGGSTRICTPVSLLKRQDSVSLSYRPKIWCARRESNSRHHALQACALPTELHARNSCCSFYPILVRAPFVRPQKQPRVGGTTHRNTGGKLRSRTLQDCVWSAVCARHATRNWCWLYSYGSATTVP